MSLPRRPMPGRWRRCSTGPRRSPVACSIRSTPTRPMHRVLDLQACQERGVRLVAPVQGERLHRAQARRKRQGQDRQGPISMAGRRANLRVSDGTSTDPQGSRTQTPTRRSGGDPTSVSLSGGALSGLSPARAMRSRSREGPNGQAARRRGVDRGSQAMDEHAGGEERADDFEVR